jgi:CRISPR-associated protein Cas2
MNLLVTYDVSTVTKAGRRRLRRVARVCQDFGQRVQCSVFECVLGETDLARLRIRLLEEISLQEDSLRLYHLHASFRDEGLVERFGRDTAIDFEGPLIA